MNGKRILVPVDLENGSHDGLHFIQGLAAELPLCATLLYVVNLNITAAKIVTEKGAAIDTFYVSEQDGRKILDGGRQEFIERKIRDAINRLG